MSSKTRQQLEDWIKTKSVNGKVIDIGGSQKPILGRINFAGETEVFILDLENPHEMDLAPQIIWDMNNPDLHFFPRQDLLGSFDYAVCLEVSEYWYDPLTALKNINKFLKRGGSVFISFHFLYPVHSPARADYLRYTRMGALKLLDAAGFKPADVVSRESQSDALMDFYKDEGMRPAREIPRSEHQSVGTLIEAIKL